jgi:hypothetical protein
MEFESKIASFAGGLFLIGSYMVLFGLWEYSVFLLVLSSILLLLVAFRDHKPGKIEAIGLLVAASLSIFFLMEFDNSTFLPMIILLCFGLLAVYANPIAFLPTLAGLLSLQFIDTSFLVKGFNLVFSNLPSLYAIKYGINDLNYVILYHSRTGMPIAIDDVKLLLPFYLALVVSQLTLLALLVIDKKIFIKYALFSIAVPLLFVILSMKNLITSPSIASFFPDNMQALALPLTCIALLSVFSPQARISRHNKRAFKSSKLTAPLLIIFFIAALLYFTPITENSDPLLIIDESHSEWEPSWTDYTKTYEKDPISGVNNYFGLLNMLSSLYNVTLIIDRTEKMPAISSVDTVLSKEINTATLENASQGKKAVLVLKCATRPYSKSEAKAVTKFLEEGNGLILISEHTDIYGMVTNLNPVAELIGYRFLPTGIQDVFTDSRGSITEKDEFPALISRYLTGDLVWETSNSLEELDGKNTLFKLVTRPSFFSHYRNETSAFFLTREFTEEIKLNSPFARHLLIAGTKYGKGKAILFTDSTQFNNGIIGFGDHAQLFIGFVEYVAQADRFNKMFAAILMLVIASILIALNRRNPATIIFVGCLLLLIAFAGSYPLSYYTTDFPDLKGEPRIVALKADESYIDDYFSGLMDLEKLMDKYFRQNQTAVILGEPSDEWIRISSRSENFNEAIVSI